MIALDSCVINFACLKKGKQSLETNIDDKFFAKFNFFDLKKAKLHVIVQIEKQETILNFSIYINGTVEVMCDLSMEKFRIPISSNYNFAAKIGKLMKI